MLYAGQDDWVHVNCALWSAEVYEELDGTLQNVHSAVARGRQLVSLKTGMIDMKEEKKMIMELSVDNKDNNVSFGCGSSI